MTHAERHQELINSKGKLNFLTLNFQKYAKIILNSMLFKT